MLKEKEMIAYEDAAQSGEATHVGKVGFNARMKVDSRSHHSYTANTL